MRDSILEKFIGLTEKEAQELCWEESYQLRVTQKDGIQYVCTMDLRFDRINVIIVEDLVVRAEIG